MKFWLHGSYSSWIPASRIFILFHEIPTSRLFLGIPVILRSSKSEGLSSPAHLVANFPYSWLTNEFPAHTHTHRGAETQNTTVTEKSWTATQTSSLYWVTTPITLVVLRTWHTPNHNLVCCGTRLSSVNRFLYFVLMKTLSKLVTCSICSH